MRIEVTQEDIDKGIPKEGSCCAIAHALVREFGTSDVYVEDEDSITVVDDYYMVLPTGKGAVEAFIRAFDKGQQVKPFSFELVERENAYDADYDADYDYEYDDGLY